MPPIINITPFTEHHRSGVVEFNGRLKEGGCTFSFDADPATTQVLHGTRNVIRPEHFVAIDEAGVVRGAYTVIFQRFCINGVTEETGFIQLPLSEGTVNPAFKTLGLRLVTDALRRCPLLFGLGMGGLQNQLPKLFRALGADVREVPFFFRVLQARPFLRHAKVARSSAARAAACDIAANTGLGNLAFGILNAITGLRAIPRRSVRFDIVDQFPADIDAVWDPAPRAYSCIAIRDRETLQFLYPASDPRYRRIVVYEGSQIVGWALVTVSQLDGHAYFGNMRLGAVINCLSLPAREDLVIAAATACLSESGAHLIVSNQFHPQWRRAMKRMGYLSYRSNFIFAAPKPLAAKIRMADPTFAGVHLNRGDGDGAYNL